MRKLAGTIWGTNTMTYRRLCTGRIRPVLEYGMTALVFSHFTIAGVTNC